MANETWNSYCGCTEQVTPCNTVFQKVDELPPLGDATRNHAYILPDNTVWVVNTDGTGYSQLNGGGTGGGGATYDDTELRELIQQLKDRNTMEDNRLTNIENLNAKQNERLTAIENKPDDDVDQDDLIPLWREITNLRNADNNLEQRIDDVVVGAGQAAFVANDALDQVSKAASDIQEINRKIESGEIGGGKTYTAGAGISISDDGVISSTVVDTDTDTDTRNTYKLSKSAKLYDVPKKLSEYGAVTTTGSALLNNAIKLALPDNVGEAMNNVVLTLPLVNFDINVNGITQHHELKNVTTVAPWLYTKNTSSARGHVNVKTKFGVLKMEFDVSASSNKVVNFEFEFFKVADTSNGVITLDAQEPSLTVPMTIENVKDGEAFGANFFDEYTITVTMDEPMMALNSLDYNLAKSTVEVIK